MINAPQEEVWPYVCTLRNQPQPPEILFRVGIAHPTDIQTIEPKVGGRRYCRLSTGDIPEEIEQFDPNARLTFRVLSTLPTMKESNPFGDLKSKRLSGYYVCRKGEFLLKRLPGGRTEMTGTSWYAPDAYWSLWTDTVVEEVRVRVMRQIKWRSEQNRLIH